MMNEKIKTRQLLQNPLWYALAVIFLAVSTSYARSLWWVTGLVALVWGGWLLQQYFSPPPQPAPSSPTDQSRLEDHLARMDAYKTKIEAVMKNTDNEHKRFHLQQLTVQLDVCTGAIDEIVGRLVSLRGDELIRHDLAAVPQAIAGLEARLAAEENTAVAAYLERALAARRNQQAVLEQLRATLIQAEIQIEHTLSVLGTIYSQILIGQSTSDRADYSRLSASIDEEMYRLTDQLEALYEVKGEYLTFAETGEV